MPESEPNDSYKDVFTLNDDATDSDYIHLLRLVWQIFRKTSYSQSFTWFFH